MKNIVAILSIVIILWPIASCYIPLEPLVPLAHYPVKAGNRWNYRRALAYYNLRSLHPGFPGRETTYVFHSTVEALGREVLNDTMDTWKFHTTETGDIVVRNLYGGYVFYRETRDALLSIAYTYPNEAAPGQDSPRQYRFAGQSFGSLGELVGYAEGNFSSLPLSGPADDSLIYESGPVKSFVFPVRVGLEWDYRIPLPPLNWRIHKKVIGTTILHLAGEDYSSYKIEWFWDTQNSGTWNPKMSGYDYLSSKGLLKREIFLKDIVITDVAFPDSAGLVDVKDEYSAISVTVDE